MNPLAFVHIPKTAGTSFRFGADAFFGEERVCRDYGSQSVETSEIVKKYIFQEKDHWKFWTVFKAEGYQFLTGHFHATRYATIFGVRSMVTFVRNPIQRIVSEYKHHVRNYGYEGTFKSYYREKANINRQLRMMANIPWPAFGLVGITERYEESLALLNSKYSLQIPFLNENLGRSVMSEAYELEPDEEAELSRLNAGEIRFYEQVCSQLDWRCRLSSVGKKYVGGAVTRQDANGLYGWAIAEEDDDPVVVQVSVGGEVVGEVTATGYRPNLQEKGAGRGGFVGFSVNTERYPKNVSLECTVAATGQPLVNSPWELLETA